VHCRSLGCLDMDCELCKQTPHRRCISTFAAKYLSGDTLKAKCGAKIRLEVIDRRTGDPVPAHVLRDTQVEVGNLPRQGDRAHNTPHRGLLASGLRLHGQDCAALSAG